MELRYTGRVWLFGDNVDTDHIIPARYLGIRDNAQMSRHCFEELRPEFSRQCRYGDILVAGRNFGCGSSREFAPMVIRECGISCVVAESFSRIFLRNAVNMGFLAAELPLCGRLIHEGDIITVDIQAGQIVNETRNESYGIKPLPPFMQRIYQAGGLEQYIVRRLQQDAKKQTGEELRKDASN